MRRPEIALIAGTLIVAAVVGVSIALPEWRASSMGFWSVLAGAATGVAITVIGIVTLWNRIRSDVVTIDLSKLTGLSVDMAEAVIDAGVDVVHRMQSSGQPWTDLHLSDLLKDVDLELWIAYPKSIRKTQSELFAVATYPEAGAEQRVRARISEVYSKARKKPSAVVPVPALVVPGVEYTICLDSPNIRFVPPKASREFVSIGCTAEPFWGTPSTTTRHGETAVMLTMEAAARGAKKVSYPFTVKVVDKLWGVVPRHWANAVSTFVSFVVSATMYVLTGLGKVEDAFGWPAGTIALLIAGYFLSQWRALQGPPRIEKIGRLMGN